MREKYEYIDDEYETMPPREMLRCQADVRKAGSIKVGILRWRTRPQSETAQRRE